MLHRTLLMSVPNAMVEDDNSHYAESEDVTSEQKQRLLYTSERLNQSGIQLDNTYRMAVETEEIGSQILTDLNHQRETMQKSFNRVSRFITTNTANCLSFLYAIHIVA